MPFPNEETLRDLKAAGEPYVRATVVWSRPPSSGKPGNTAIVRGDGSVHGWIGGACAEPVIVGEAREVLVSGTPRLVFLGPVEEAGRPNAHVVPMSCASEGALEIFMEPVLPEPHVVIVGRSPAVATLARLVEVMHWRVSIVDEDGKRGAGLDGLSVVTSFADAGTPPPTAIVVATQGHHDESALEWALSTGAGYIGLVSSATRAETVRDYLRSSSFSDEDIARLRAPAGIDFGPIAHEDIAVSILAELVAQKSAGAFKVPIVDVPPVVASAIDPVCGMTVEIETARFTHEHEGETIYFCCPGCRSAFIADPESYATT